MPETNLREDDKERKKEKKSHPNKPAQTSLFRAGVTQGGIQY